MIRINDTSSLLAAPFIIFTIFPSTAFSASDWVGDWFNQATTTSSGQYQSQQRGYFTGGGFDARIRMTNDHLVSATPPSIKVGCGGIDLMAGSMSYLNPEYLVQKMQRILQAAPAFAFDLAMQEYCKPCTASLQFLENAADTLNGLQMSDCQAASKIATVMVHPSEAAAQLQGVSASYNAIANGLQDSVQQFQSAVRSSGGKSPNPNNATAAGCPADFNSVFTSGSVIQNAAAYIGLSQYSNLLRGLLGDVIVTFDASTNLYRTDYRAACIANDDLTGKDFYNGTINLEDSDGNCTQPASGSVLNIVNGNLVSIADSIKTGTALTASQQAFINSTPFPLYIVLKDGVAAGNSDQIISIIDTVLAQQYTTRVLSDFYTMTQRILLKAEQLKKTTAASSGGSSSCNMDSFASALSFLNEAHDRTASLRMLSTQASTMAINEANNSMAFARAFYDQHRQIMNNHATVIDGGRK